MFTRLIVGVALLTASAAGAPATPTTSLPSEIRASLVTFPEITRVCDHYLLGQYVVVHDEGRMARGDRGYIVELFESHNLFETFKAEYWPNGDTADGARRIKEYRKWKKEYEDQGHRRPW